MDKKKTSYYYDEEIEKLIEDGMKEYESKFHEGKLTLTRFIDLCIRHTINVFPSLIKKQETQIQSLQKENEDLKKEKEMYLSIIRQDVMIMEAVVKQGQHKKVIINTEL